jgi:Protein of unknown function (DUF1566)
MMRIPMLTLLILMLVAGAAGAGSLEPSAPPGPTMKTLDEIPPTWSQVLPAAARFQVINAMNSNGVLDKETGLVWARLPSSTSSNYIVASFACLSQSLVRGGWRLPTTSEMTSLWDGSASAAPFLPIGHPFIGVQAGAVYWTANTPYDLTNPGRTARTVSFDNQFGPALSIADKAAGSLAFWCVRGSGGGSVIE